MGFDYSRKNKRWRRLRERVLREQKWCQESERYGVRRPAEVVHHVWPAEDYPEFAYCRWNLVALTAEAHDRMHDRLTRKLTPLGERWRRRTIPPGSDPQAWGRLQLGGGPRAHAAEKSGGEKNPGPGQDQNQA